MTKSNVLTFIILVMISVICGKLRTYAGFPIKLRIDND